VAVERAATVESVADDGQVRLRLAAECSDCLGCSGRCALIGTTAGNTVELPLAQFDSLPRGGQHVVLYLPDAALLQQARRGYGRPTAGLLVGAVAGHLLAISLNATPDLWAVLGAATGTLTGLYASKRSTLPPCRVSLLADGAGAAAPLPTDANEDTAT
jgi:positive regulator of sigma E activity